MPLTKNPRSYKRERTPLYYLMTKPRALPIVAGFLRRRAFWPAPVEQVTTYVDGTLDVPGRPQVVFTPVTPPVTARSISLSATR